MASPLRAWLEKATLSVADLTGGTDGGLLSAGQAAEFLRVAIAQSVLVNQCRVESNDSPSFEVPRMSFGSRILKKGTEATRNVDGDRVKPTTGLCAISTYLFRGEVPISDEVFEDNVEREGLADSIAQMIAEAVGRDIEEYALLNNTVRATPADDAGGYAVELDVFDGLVLQLVGQAENATTGMLVPAAQNIADASTYTTFDSLFAAMMEKLPSQYRRDLNSLRFFTSYKLRDRYRASLTARGTPLGDRALIDDMALTYGGIPVIGIPMLTGTHTINTAAMVYDNVAFLCNPKNILFGFHRRVKLEWYRDPREGARSAVVSVRFDTKLADPNAFSTAKKISSL